MSIGSVLTWDLNTRMMLICKNCGSTNKLGVTKCTSCSMPGMLIEKAKQPTQDAVKPIYPTCINCGTNEIGSGTKCKKCNFPIQAQDKQTKNIINQYQTKAS